MVYNIVRNLYKKLNLEHFHKQNNNVCLLKENQSEK